MKRTAITAMATLLLAVLLPAQSPDKMSYQAVIRDANGILQANKEIGMRISIIQGSESGTIVYQEIYFPNRTTNANGLVSLEIGGGLPLLGTFSAIDWSDGPYFLKSETDPTGGTSYTIAGTTPLLSVPYALHAKTAESVTGGVTEVDPTVPEHVKEITLTDLGRWNSALLQGTAIDVASVNIDGVTIIDNAGTWVGPPIPEQDPYFMMSAAAAIVAEDIERWNTALLRATSIDVVSVMVGGVTIIDNAGTWVGPPIPEQDPHFMMSAAAAIVAEDIDKWNVVHAWGDHNTMGYLTGDPTINTSIANSSYKMQVIYPSLRFIGRLFDNEDDAVSSEVTVSVSLYDSPSGGSMLWSEQHSLNVGNGYFEILMGSDGVPLSSELFLNYPNLYIGFSIDSEIFSGRIPLYKHGRAAVSDYSEFALSLQGYEPVDFLHISDFEATVAAGITSNDIDKWNNKQDKLTAGEGIDITANVISATTGVKTYQVGDVAQGGVVFYVEPCGTRGLVVALTDQSSGIRWHAGTDGDTHAKGSGIYAGRLNLPIIIATHAAIGDDGVTYAARICNELTITLDDVEYGDWFLPSQWELISMFMNRSAINAAAITNGGTAFAEVPYWSSTETTNSFAIGLNFATGTSGGNSKNDATVRVRAIRQF